LASSRPDSHVKKALSRGAPNRTLNLEDCARLVFYRELGEIVAETPDFEMLYKENPSLKIIFMAMLAKAYKCGNCYEHACVGYVRRLKCGDFKSLEMIAINGIKKDFGVNHNEVVPEAHWVVVENRKEDSELQVTPTWGNCKAIDFWNDSLLEGDAVSRSNIASPYGLVGELSIVSEDRISRPLRREEFIKITESLSRLHQILSLDLIQKAIILMKEKYKTHGFSLQREHARIHASLEREIISWKKQLDSELVLRDESKLLIGGEQKSYSPRHFMQDKTYSPEFFNSKAEMKDQVKEKVVVQSVLSASVSC
jgi:hypothetical protein